MRVLQLLPSLAYGDAIGNETLALKKVLKEMKYETAIYAESIDSRLPFGTAKPFSSLPPLRDEDVIIYHGSTGSRINDALPGLGGRKMMIYHNITPPEFFWEYNANAAQNAESGLLGIRQLADEFDYCIADSSFNKSDLIKMGYQCPIDVCPLIIPFDDYAGEANQQVLQSLQNDPKVTWIFTGRVAPNKKQEDVIRAFYYYHKYLNPDSRLIFVGSWAAFEAYHDRLVDYVKVLGLEESVLFTGHVKFNEILAYYQSADVFVCMSEHEGFCVPVLEAMYFNKPVIAYNSCAVPETMGGGGVLLSERDPKYVAGLVDCLLTNPSLKEKVLEQQRRRLEELQYDKIKSRFEQLLSSFIQSPRKDHTRIIQLVSGVYYGDAVGNDVLSIDRALKERDVRTEIYAGEADSRIPAGIVKPYSEMRKLRPKDLVIYHFAVASSISHDIGKFPCKVVLRYHNVTPPAFFRGLNKVYEDATALGLQQVKSIRPSVDFCMPDSSFNAEDLQRMGYTCPMRVLPVLIPFGDYEKEPDRKVIERYSDGRTNILFVGRMAPNKKIEDVISAFAQYKKNYDPTARLFLVGSYDEADIYYQNLRKHISALGVSDVMFSGHIPFSAILSYYRLAHVFLCMSEHEGFCVPLTEAMYFRIPIIAYNCCAVPGTLGGGGVLVKTKDFDEIACMINRLVQDRDYRKEIVEKQDERLKNFSYEVVGDQLYDILQEFLRE